MAFALIKTEGLDEVSRTRITRESQAMGRLLGLLSHTIGDLDQAVSHLEDALGFCREAGYLPGLA